MSGRLVFLGLAAAVLLLTTACNHPCPDDEGCLGFAEAKCGGDASVRIEQASDGRSLRRTFDCK